MSPAERCVREGGGKGYDGGGRDVGRGYDGDASTSVLARDTGFADAQRVALAVDSFVVLTCLLRHTCQGVGTSSRLGLGCDDTLSPRLPSLVISH
jgi:hypothetical protein